MFSETKPYTRIAFAVIEQLRFWLFDSVPLEKNSEREEQP